MQIESGRKAEKLPLVARKRRRIRRDRHSGCMSGDKRAALLPCVLATRITYQFLKTIRIRSKKHPLRCVAVANAVISLSCA